jgi:hypothetical protein
LRNDGSTKRPTVIQDVPIEGTIEQLERDVASFERRFKRSSDQALADVKAGKLRETAEIARWLIAHRVLKDLREALALHTTGQR